MSIGSWFFPEVAASVPTPHIFVCFWLHHTACGILVPWPGIELGSTAVKTQVLTSGPPGISPYIFREHDSFPSPLSLHHTHTHTLSDNGFWIIWWNCGLFPARLGTKHFNSCRLFWGLRHRRLKATHKLQIPREQNFFLSLSVVSKASNNS